MCPRSSPSGAPSSLLGACSIPLRVYRPEKSAACRRPPGPREGSRRLQEALGGSRRLPEAPGGSRRLREAPGRAKNRPENTDLATNRVGKGQLGLIPRPFEAHGCHGLHGHHGFPPNPQNPPKTRGFGPRAPPGPWALRFPLFSRCGYADGILLSAEDPWQERFPLRYVATWRRCSWVPHEI